MDMPTGNSQQYGVGCEWSRLRSREEDGKRETDKTKGRASP